MSANKCPTCRYRSGPSAVFCANCGTRLNSSEMPSYVSATDMSPWPLQISAQPGRLSGPVRNVIVNQAQEESFPYQTTLPEQAMSIEPLAPLSLASTASREPLARVPFGFALSRPRLVGVIIHNEVREQANDMPNVAGAALAILAEVIWALPNVQTTRDAVDRIETTHLRIQSEDGRMHDCTVRGVLRGASLSLGDTVSLWGHRRKGNLMVRKGYDHTTRSAISTRATGALIPALLILAVICFCYLSFAHLSLTDIFQYIKEIPDWIRSQVFPFLK